MKMISMSSKYSNMKLLNGLSFMIYYYKNRSFKASLIVAGKFFHSSDDEIDEILESKYDIFDYNDNSYKGKMLCIYKFNSSCGFERIKMYPVIQNHLME